MKSPSTRFALVLLLSLLCGNFAIVSAQTTNATLSGTITDPSGKVAPGVEVTVLNTDTGVSATSRTNNEGVYTISGLQYGHYRVVVTHDGFKRIELTSVTLEVAASVTRNFQLELGTSSQTVTVEGNALNINTTDGSVSTVIDREFVDQIPLNGRTLQNLLPLSPGIVADGLSGPGNTGYSGFTVNGTRSIGSANWTVDGVSANIGATLNGQSPDTLAGALTILGTTQSMISLDALQEFRVSTSSYGVEYGVAPGAQIQIESRAGTNRVHGSAYDYVRNTIFDANDWFADQEGLPKAPEQQNDFGATLGGPIWIPHAYDGRDKAFFFFSFEDLHLLQPQALADQPVPTASGIAQAPAALQPYLKAFPSPTPGGTMYESGTWGSWNASFSQPSFLKAWSIRGDYALSKSTNLFVHVNYAPSHVGGLEDAYNSTDVVNDTMATVGVTSMLTSTISNDFRFNFSNSYYAQVSNLLSSKFGGTQAPAIALLTPPSEYTAPSGGGFFSDIVFQDFNSYSPDAFGGFATLQLGSEHSRLHQWDLVDGLNWQIGRHLLKFGGEWNRHTPIQAPIGYSETVEFDSVYPPQPSPCDPDEDPNGCVPSSLASSTADEVDVGSQPYTTSTINTRSALYAGDTWKVNQRLSVDYGVRWELPFPTYFKGPYVPIYVNSIANLDSPNVTQGRTEWNMTWRNFAPRLGVAYQVRESNNFETVLRMGGGLFYSTELGAGVGNVTYPNTATTSSFDVDFPPDSSDPSLLVPPPTGTVTPEGLAENPLVGADQHLAVPRVWEWNVAVEQGLGANQSLTATYVGSAGRKLFFWPDIFPNSGNIEEVSFTENGSRSDYNSLQLRFDRHLTRGLQMLASYTWAHSLDSASQDDISQQPLWGNSDFDVRHAFSLGLVYDIPGAAHNWALKQITSGWEITTNFQARTGLPVTGLFAPSKFLPNGEFTYVEAEINPGVPFYVHGSQYPGGTALNAAAFKKPAAGTDGDAGRNQFRDQDLWQDDLSVQRKFVLGEKWGTLRFRFDAFNIVNHPNFGGYFVRNLVVNNPLFGQATAMADLLGPSSPIYNPGGPRSLQLSLRYEF